MIESWFVYGLLGFLVILPFFSLMSLGYLVHLARSAPKPPVLLTLLIIEAFISLASGSFLSFLTITRLLGGTVIAELLPFTILSLVAPLTMINVIAFVLWRTSKDS